MNWDYKPLPSAKPTLVRCKRCGDEFEVILGLEELERAEDGVLLIDVCFECRPDS